MALLAPSSEKLGVYSCFTSISVLQGHVCAMRFTNSIVLFISSKDTVRRRNAYEKTKYRERNTGLDFSTREKVLGWSLALQTEVDIAIT